MDQREEMISPSSGFYTMDLGTAEPVTHFQGSPSMNPLSNTTIHFQSNTGGSLMGPTFRMDASSTMSPRAVSVGQSSVMLHGEPVRRKRGRPRKYGQAAALSALLPSTSTSAAVLGTTQKRRGRPPGSGRKQQLSSLGGSLFSGGGTMTAHVLNVAVGEDINRKILSYLQGQWTIVILSGHGSISAANIKISSSGRIVSYEGRFDIVSLSGSYTNNVDALHGPTGGLNLTLAGPDGRVIGGLVEGVLVAASPVQVILGSLLPRTSKPIDKAVENLDPPGDSDHRKVTPSAVVQPSQNLSPIGVWPSIS